MKDHRSRRAAWTWLACAFVVLLAPPAAAELADAQQSCQREVGRQGRSYFRSGHALAAPLQGPGRARRAAAGDRLHARPGDRGEARARREPARRRASAASAATRWSATWCSATPATAPRRSRTSPPARPTSTSSRRRRLVGTLFDASGPVTGRCAHLPEERGAAGDQLRLQEARPDPRLQGRRRAAASCRRTPTATTTTAARVQQGAHDASPARSAASAPTRRSRALPFGAPCTGVATSNHLVGCLRRQPRRRRRPPGRDRVRPRPGRHGAASSRSPTPPTECVKGPLSRCRNGDYLLANDQIRVVVQDIQRNILNVGQFGGQIIDADLVRAPGDPDRDNFEEWAISINIENAAHYTALTDHQRRQRRPGRRSCARPASTICSTS